MSGEGVIVRQQQQVAEASRQVVCPASSSGALAAASSEQRAASSKHRAGASCRPLLGPGRAGARRGVGARNPYVPHQGSGNPVRHNLVNVHM